MTMRDTRHKSMTYQGVKQWGNSLEEVLAVFSIDGFVPDDEFAADMDLLVSGKMSPEEHRVYLKDKYNPQH